MTKRNQSAVEQQGVHRSRTPERASATGSRGDLTNLAEPIGALLMAAGMNQGAAEMLGSTRFQTAQRRALATAIGRVQGNEYIQRVVASRERVGATTTRETATVQLDRGRRGRGAHPGGRGAGRIQHATTNYYNVSGATLQDITGQLGHLYASETNAPITIQGTVTPQRVGDVYQVRVRWIISGATVSLPRWTGYDAACPAAQREWDRFMGQTRQHEQQAHVDAARTFVQNLGDEDTVITGSTVAELRENLLAKQQDLARRLQAIHDSCDHGVSIDAILHPDRGRCSREE